MAGCDRELSAWRRAAACHRSPARSDGPRACQLRRPVRLRSVRRMPSGHIGAHYTLPETGTASIEHPMLTKLGRPSTPGSPDRRLCAADRRLSDVRQFGGTYPPGATFAPAHCRTSHTPKCARSATEDAEARRTPNRIGLFIQRLGNTFLLLWTSTNHGERRGLAAAADLARRLSAREAQR
jgi:hypothetical protein